MPIAPTTPGRGRYPLSDPRFTGRRRAEESPQRRESELAQPIARIDGRLYAFDDLCTCADERCPLSSGLLSGTTVMCQCHGSRYDVITGQAISGPANTNRTQGFQ